MKAFDAWLSEALDELAAPSAGRTRDWSDVVRRAQLAQRAAGRRRLNTVLALAAAMALVAALLAPPAGVGAKLWGLLAGDDVPSSRLVGRDWRVLSAIDRGASVATTAIPSRPEFQKVGVRAVRRIAVKEQLAFYVIDRATAGDCYALGIEGAAELFGVASCPADGEDAFPSAQEPVLDLSVFTSSTPGEPGRIERLSGFAADGVAAVGIVTEAGKVEARTPVIANTYLRSNGLPDRPTRAIVAFDADGTRVYFFCTATDGC